MKVPSYDDLTPSIPDVHPRDTFDLVTRLVTGREEPVVRGAAGDRAAAGEPRGLFACVRSKTGAGGAVFALARDFSPRIERHGEQAVVLDVGGLGRLLGDAHGIAAELRRTADERGIKSRIAVAPTQTAARLLALHRDDAVVTGDVAAALAVLPLEVLRDFRLKAEATQPTRSADFRLKAEATQHTPSGGFRLQAEVDRATGKLLDTLHRWGLRTIGEFAALPADELASRFGQQGLALHRLARGIDPRPLAADPGVPRFIQSMELEWPLEELEPLSFVLARLLDPLSAALEKADRGAAAIRLDLRLADRTAHTRTLQLPAAMRDARVLRTLLLLDLESHPPSAGIDVVTIEADPAPGRIVQFSLLEHAMPSPETIATLTARLGALVGDSRCGSPVLLDSHRPDAFDMQRFNPGVRPKAPSEAEVPRVVLRRFRPPVAIRVSLDRGRPAHVPIDRKGMPGGRVAQAAGPWRTSGGWWDAGGRWDRDEWDVALADGSVCRIYRERETGRWFMDGVVD